MTENVQPKAFASYVSGSAPAWHAIPLTKMPPNHEIGILAMECVLNLASFDSVTPWTWAVGSWIHGAHDASLLDAALASFHDELSSMTA